MKSSIISPIGPVVHPGSDDLFPMQYASIGRKDIRMKSLSVLALLVALAVSSAPATKHTVTTSGFTFTPATLSITEGDTVVFSISALHNAQEVNQSTWNVNGTTPLGGGFTVPDGGGEAVPTGTGIHYYICTNHALSGMKGTITVNPASVTPSSITINSIVDRDGNIASTLDRMGKNWSLRLYRDSIGSGIVVDSLVSGWTLLADSLTPGTYVAVEADSAHWTHLSHSVDGSSQGVTVLNFHTISIGPGEDHTIDFQNYAQNVIISSGLTFAPETLTVDSSDTVRFVLDTMHKAREVDSLTWLAGDTVSNGGFDLPFGEGDVIPGHTGKFYYVCIPHVSSGMKGIIVVKRKAALSLSVADGWNLLSMPYTPVDGSVAVLYPTATSSAYTYHAGYEGQTSVSPGTGYWLKFVNAQSVGLDGTPINADTVAVSQGWNIVGSISVPVAAASIQSDPGGLVTSSFFGYNLGYSPVDTLRPGFGYWVKVGGSGSLILQPSPASAPAAGRIRIVPTSEVPPAGKPDR